MCPALAISSHRQRHAWEGSTHGREQEWRVKAPSVALLHTNVCFCTEVGDIFVLTLPSFNSLVFFLPPLMYIFDGNTQETQERNAAGWM